MAKLTTLQRLASSPYCPLPRDEFLIGYKALNTDEFRVWTLLRFAMIDWADSPKVGTIDITIREVSHISGVDKTSVGDIFKKFQKLGIISKLGYGVYKIHKLTEGQFGLSHYTVNENKIVPTAKGQLEKNSMAEEGTSHAQVQEHIRKEDLGYVNKITDTWVVPGFSNLTQGDADWINENVGVKTKEVKPVIEKEKINYGGILDLL